jgi:hypothetical protein
MIRLAGLHELYLIDHTHIARQGDAQPSQLTYDRLNGLPPIPLEMLP